MRGDPFWYDTVNFWNGSSLLKLDVRCINPIRGFWLCRISKASPEQHTFVFFQLLSYLSWRSKNRIICLQQIHARITQTSVLDLLDQIRTCPVNNLCLTRNSYEIKVGQGLSHSIQIKRVITLIEVWDSGRLLTLSAWTVSVKAGQGEECSYLLLLLNNS